MSKRQIFNKYTINCIFIIYKRIRLWYNQIVPKLRFSIFVLIFRVCLCFHSLLDSETCLWLKRCNFFTFCFCRNMIYTTRVRFSQIFTLKKPWPCPRKARAPDTEQKKNNDRRWASGALSQDEPAVFIFCLRV